MLYKIKQAAFLVTSLLIALIIYNWFFRDEFKITVTVNGTAAEADIAIHVAGDDPKNFAARSLPFTTTFTAYGNDELTVAARNFGEKGSLRLMVDYEGRNRNPQEAGEWILYDKSCSQAKCALIYRAHLPSWKQD